MRLAVRLLFLLFAPALMAQSNLPLDVKSMLQGLQDLKVKHTKSAQSTLAQTIADFSAAAASDDAALAFYEEAVRVTQFVGQDREQTAFHDWKKKEAPKLVAPAIRAAIRYTTISLQRAAGATDKQIFPVLLEYAQDTASMLPSIWGQEIVKEPVSTNIFAKWYDLTDQLSGLDANWEPAPENVDGMYEKVLLPYMRSTRDPRILEYWDNKIATETAAASAATAAFATDNFNQSRRPQLLWSRAEDEVAIGQRDQGLNDMYSIVKNFPTHPDAGKWIDELQGLLTGARTTGTGAPPAAATGTTGH